MAIEIFLTGASGILGQQLISISNEFDVKFIFYSSMECDITKYYQLKNKISSFKGNLVVHTAAMTNIVEAQKNPIKAIEINTIGTINLIKVCSELNKKLVFISTDHVFDGSEGNYSINSRINPISNYAKSKAAAEIATSMFEENLIIRTSFCGKQFPYDRALIDQWTSKDYVDVIAPIIIEKILNNEKGIVFVGTERKTLYELASRRHPEIEKISIDELQHVCRVGNDYSFKNQGVKND